VKTNRQRFPSLNPRFKIQNLKLSLVVAAILCFAAMKNRAQQALSGSATDFTSVEYYPAPDEAQVKSRLSGTQASPMPGGLLVIKQFKLEMFNTNGMVQAVVNAPECTYDTLHGVANSPGQLFLQNGDGKIRIQGVGFLWRQTDSFLTISNNVRTVIENDVITPQAGNGKKTS
jgi:hypothetical protein